MTTDPLDAIVAEAVTATQDAFWFGTASTPSIGRIIRAAILADRERRGEMTDDDREMFEACVMGLRGESYDDRADWLEAYVADRERRGAEVEALRAAGQALDEALNAYTIATDDEMAGRWAWLEVARKQLALRDALAATDAPARPDVE